ncbi:hypothetical protein BJV82DRAFT_618069 [Fennellomyces sp. T-0311]|nr:hypothetical protein BJV82DRAFT_618069 [Fennellomyces sp. T-0311]
MHLSQLALAIVLLVQVSAHDVDLKYCGQNDLKTNIPDGVCNDLAFQDFCGFAVVGGSAICELFTDLNCNNQPCFSGVIDATPRGKLGSIRCNQR